MRGNLALTLLLSFAFLAKGLIPSGWMPTGQKAFEIAICTGADTHSVWLDDKGQLHKQDPGKKSGEKTNESSCAFAALAGTVDTPNDAPSVARIAISDRPHPAVLPAAIGQGLAAPPPPATGPPLLI